MKPRIVCACNLVHFGDETFKLIGARHWDKNMISQCKVLIKLHGEKHEYNINVDQGFIDQFGKYYNRKDAWVIAENNGQIIREVSSKGTLYSENLY